MHNSAISFVYINCSMPLQIPVAINPVSVPKSLQDNGDLDFACMLVMMLYVICYTSSLPFHACGCCLPEAFVYHSCTTLKDWSVAKS